LKSEVTDLQELTILSEISMHQLARAYGTTPMEIKTWNEKDILIALLTSEVEHDTEQIKYG
jgi:hypothetical protein